MPCHAIYTRWTFAGRSAKLEFDITIHNDPGSEVGLYLSPFNGEIDGAKIYFGLQTNVNKPVDPKFGSGRVTNVGKGLLFSTWWTFDANDARVADDGFYQLGTHEGGFLGVRRKFEWTPGDYRIRLARADASNDNASDWFDLTIECIEPIEERKPSSTKTTFPNHEGSEDRNVNRPGPRGEPFWIGALRFKRKIATVPATICANGPAFLEVYSGAQRFIDVPKWWVDLQAFSDGKRAVSAKSEYPSYPHGQEAPNADTWYEVERDRVHLQFGGDAQKRNRSTQLF
jgi:hypothetical protein